MRACWLECAPCSCPLTPTEISTIYQLYHIVCVRVRVRTRAIARLTVCPRGTEQHDKLCVRALTSIQSIDNNQLGLVRNCARFGRRRWAGRYLYLHFYKFHKQVLRKVKGNIIFKSSQHKTTCKRASFVCPLTPIPSIDHNQFAEPKNCEDARAQNPPNEAELFDDCYK